MGGEVTAGVKGRSLWGVALVLRLLLVTIVFLPSGSNGVVYATPRGEVTVGGEVDLQERLKKIEEEIRRYQERLKEVQKKEFSVLKELERINSELEETKRKINTHRNRLGVTEKRLAMTQSEIKELQTRLQMRKEWLKRRLRSLWIYGYTREMEFLLSSREPGEFMRNWRYLTLLSRYDRKVMDRLKEEIEGLRKKEAELSGLREEIKKTLSMIQQEELNLLKTRREKGVLLSAVRHNKEQYRKMLEELNESARRLTRIIEESRIRAGPEGERTFLSKRGRLPWPVNGRVKIPFGSQKDSLTGLPVFRSGVFIATEDNAVVSSIFNGKVAYVGELKGYGKVIIISHGGNYHSVYGNLSEIFLKPGDIILEGQAIGRVGESQIMEGTGLYFEIRYRGKPLDPLQWLKRR